MQYLYKEGDSFVFMDTTNYEQVSIPGETMGDDAQFMPEQTVVDVLFFQQRAVGVTLPNFIEQKIVETEPGFRGDTATGTTKPAKIATGATVNVPLFINVGDTIKIDTRTGAIPRARRARLTRRSRPTACPTGCPRCGPGRAHPAGGSRLLSRAGLPRGRDAGPGARARPGGAPRRVRRRWGGRYLITSPEYHMKRLVAAGSGPHLPDRAVPSGPRRAGPQHQPEFTIVEWYRAGAAAGGGGRRLRGPAARGRAGRGHVPGGRPAAGAGRRLRTDHGAGAAGPARGHRARAATRPRRRWRRRPGRPGSTLGTASAWDDVFFQIFLDRVEPAPGRSPADLRVRLAAPRWPPWPGARPDDPRLAERFELYAGGLELANAFGELTDPGEQRARFVEESARRKRGARTVYPVDEKLLAALAPDAPHRRGSRWASTAWSCWRWAGPTSARCSPSRTTRSRALPGPVFRRYPHPFSTRGSLTP